MTVSKRENGFWLMYWNLKGYKNIHPDALWDSLVVELMVDDEGIVIGIAIEAYK